ncbi:toprim domain-containing protein [Pedobacter roseus]|uniref:Toprim domain-containing protein n=1 Tax=Pedobacter roseus TaxID=336820 RepID=A0A7G9QI06_9SPHI|nr:toprim domain-containing protein [Pedobacter roseus]QNN42981.1 toprim domain-containing protein [Pedobacter roseus]
MEENRIDLKSLKEGTDLVLLLSKLGFEPIKRSGGELFYLSMLRDNDTSPSFCVNEKLGIWYDHGLAKGGTVVDFALAYWPGLDFRQAMEKLISHAGGSGLGPLAARPRQAELPMRHPSYLIRETRPIGTKAAISDFLSGRGILKVAPPYLREVYYSVKKEGEKRMELFAAGWQNGLGGWEVRSKNFKGCLGKKSMSFISGSGSSLAVFEGMMDFLSWKLDYPQATSSALILNSVAFLKPAILMAGDYHSVELYFDHDLSGRKASGEFLKSHSGAVDRSEIYRGYNDYNEMTQHSISPGKQSITQKENLPFKSKTR